MFQPEMVHVQLAKPLHATETTALECPGKNEMHVDRVVANTVDARKTHLRHERDAGLGGGNAARSAPREEPDEPLEQQAPSLALPGEKFVH
jgi:hypothetical protein